MKILVAGATGSIGIHVVNTAIAMGHQPVALVRNRRKIKLLPRGTDIFYGDVSIPETLTDLPKDIDAIIFTLGSDGQGRIGSNWSQSEEKHSRISLFCLQSCGMIIHKK